MQSLIESAPNIAGLSNIVQKSEFELAAWLYGLLALALISFAMSFAKTAGPAKRWRIAAGALAVMAMLSDHWVHPRYIPELCALAGAHTESGPLSERENVQIFISEDSRTEYVESRIWEADGMGCDSK